MGGGTVSAQLCCVEVTAGTLIRVAWRGMITAVAVLIALPLLNMYVMDGFRGLPRVVHVGIRYVQLGM